MKKLIPSLLALGALWLAPPAQAEAVSSVLGVPCTTQADGTQFCQGDLGHRVRTFDGVPLDVDLRLPPADQDGPFPLIVWIHGYSETKDFSVPGSLIARVRDGYVLMSYSARGFGASCGTAASQADPGCAAGYVRLADARYEVRDTQYLAGRLADLDLVQPRKIGVTGHSYGAGQSYMLATLRDRVMRPDGKLRPWTSPGGKPMEIAAAVPEFGWTDLAYALMPNGRTLDTRVHNPYGTRVGVSKQSWMAFLYFVGLGDGHYAAPGTDPEADITTWFARIAQGEPYDTDPQAHEMLGKIKRFHSAYYLQRGLPASQRERPAPILAYNAWTDDIFPADESIRYYTWLKAQFPGAEYSLLFMDGQGHPRADLLANTTGLNSLRVRFFERLLRGGPGRPLGVRTYTQGCSGQPVRGPFATPTWDAQHPGAVRFRSPGAESFDGTGGDPATAQAVDPFAGGPCRTVPAVDEPNTAVYRLPAVSERGYTLLGSPVVTAKIATATPLQAQVDARLWDVAPDNSQDFVTRAIYRPDASGRQTFQLHPHGWRFAPGHVAKLELLGRDPTYARPSNGAFDVSVENLQLTLPTREPCPLVRTGGPKRNRLKGTPSGDKLRGRGDDDILLGYQGRDCLLGGQGSDAEIGGAGPDRVSGGAGFDLLLGAGGPDTLIGGVGTDILISVRGGADRVRCGPGYDGVVADASDRISGCEQRLRLSDVFGPAAARTTAGSSARSSLRRGVPDSSARARLLRSLRP